MIQNSYSHIINNLKLTRAKKNFMFDIRVNSKIINLLEVFLNLNIIRRFYFINSTTCRVYPTYYKDKSLIPNLKNYYSKTRKIYLTADTLKILNKSTYNTTFILETNRGLITHRNALNYNIGGSLICTIL